MRFNWHRGDKHNTVAEPSVGVNKDKVSLNMWESHFIVITKELNVLAHLHPPTLPCTLTLTPTHTHMHTYTHTHPHSHAHFHLYIHSHANTFIETVIINKNMRIRARDVRTK